MNNKVVLSVLPPVEDENICEICGKRFVYRSSYLEHIRRCVKVPVPASFDCVLCDKVLHSMRCLTDHIRMHTRECPYKCDKCHKLFIRKDQFTTHKKIHEVDKENKQNHKSNTEHVEALKKQFKCPYCTKQCTRQSHLHSHIRAHTGQLTDECELCGKFFLRSDHLERHKVVHKLDLTNKQCFCAVCGLQYSQELLKTHMMEKHHEPMPFKCNKCDKCFKTKENLSFHERVHDFKTTNIR